MSCNVHILQYISVTVNILPTHCVVTNDLIDLISYFNGEDFHRIMSS
jgi:hypothetical protein